MNNPYELPQTPAPANKTLWAAVAVLGVAVLAMGATLIRIQSQQREPSLAVVPAVAPASSASSPAPAALPAPEVASAPASVAKESVAVVAPANTKKPVAPVHKAPPAPKPVAYQAPVWNGAPAQPQVYAPAPAVAPAPTYPAPTYPAPVQVAKPICVNCGVVESVIPIQREGTGSGLGAVAGAVVGGVLGNQVGGGDGKTAATVLGVFGGSIAGNAIEKKMKKDTAYEVRVRMEDGSTRTLEQTTPASVGTKVIVDGNTLQPTGR